MKPIARLSPLICIVGVVSSTHAGIESPVLVSGFEDSEGSGCGSLSYSENFSAGDGSPWPVDWTAVGSVDIADIVDGAARLRPTPSGYSLARMFAPINTRDVELRFTFRLEDFASQGVGFYVRSSGEYLNPADPRGGYAVFLEGSFRGLPGAGVWREVDGREEPLAHSSNSPDPIAGPAQGQDHRVRFRVHQLDPGATLLQAKMWPVAEPEPVGWHVSFVDSTPALQGVSGGIAIDSWSNFQNPPIEAHTLVDDIEIEPLCNPLEARGGLDPVVENLQFGEGPLWREDHLLFSDIDANTIYRLDPPASVSVFRNPSNEANGLAMTPAGELLAAEHLTRQVSRATDSQTVVIADRFEGNQFNSPNDLAVAQDGTIYFTDPSYGLGSRPRELDFNGVFRIDPAGVVHLEWQGLIGVNEPNGVAISTNGQNLYVSDTMAGELLLFPILGGAQAGELGPPQALARGLTIPDGICLDRHGNVFVATWLPSVEVFTPDGARWGNIPLDRVGTNCAFDEGDETLFVTTRETLYRIPMAVGGR